MKFSILKIRSVRRLGIKTFRLFDRNSFNHCAKTKQKRFLKVKNIILTKISCKSSFKMFENKWNLNLDIWNTKICK